MLPLPPYLQLTGGDYFIHAIDRQMRQAGLAGNICRLILRLNGRLDADRLRRAVGGSEPLRLLAGARMIRRLPILSPKWLLNGDGSGLPVTEQEADGPGDSEEEIASSAPPLNLRSGAPPALALGVVQRPDGHSCLVLTWHHSLMDVRGAERLLSHLRSLLSGGSDDGLVLVDRDQYPISWPRLWREFPRRVINARESLAFITRTCRAPFVSLVERPGQMLAPRNRFRILRFNEAETARIDRHCVRIKAAFRRSLFYLAASAKAVQAIVQRRGGAEGAFVVPVPHDLRKRGEAGPLFSNQVSFLFFRIEPEDLASLRGIIAALSRQMMDQIREGFPNSFRVAMELFRPVPLGFYIRQLKRPTKGRVATFFFSDASESCAGLEDIMGAPVEDVTHLAPASAPPGLTLIFSRYHGRMSVVISFVEGCLDHAEEDLLGQTLRAELLSEGEE